MILSRFASISKCLIALFDFAYAVNGEGSKDGNDEAILIDTENRAECQWNKQACKQVEVRRKCVLFCSKSTSMSTLSCFLYGCNGHRARFRAILHRSQKRQSMTCP